MDEETIRRHQLRELRPQREREMANHRIIEALAERRVQFDNPLRAEIVGDSIEQLPGQVEMDRVKRIVGSRSADRASGRRP